MYVDLDRKRRLPFLPEVVGVVTSAPFGHTLGRAVAMGYVPSSHASRVCHFTIVPQQLLGWTVGCALASGPLSFSDPGIFARANPIDPASILPRPGRSSSST